MLQLDLNMLLVTDIKTKHTDLLFRLHNCCVHIYIIKNCLWCYEKEQAFKVGIRFEAAGPQKNSYVF